MENTTQRSRPISHPQTFASARHDQHGVVGEMKAYISPSMHSGLLVDILASGCGSAEQTPAEGGDEAGGDGLTRELGEGQ